MPVPDAVLELMQKLKNMTVENGCAPSEAENAAARLQKFLTDHQLSVADLEGRELGEEMDRVDIHDGPTAVRGKRWRKSSVQYAINIAHAFDCKVCFWPTQITFVGLASDVRVAEFFFSTTREPIIREGKRQAKRRGHRGQHILSFSDSFLGGAGIAVHERLRRQREHPAVEQANSAVAQQDASNVTALVALKKQKVEEFFDETFPTAKVKDMSVRAGDGTAAGYRHGMGMELQQGLNGGRPVAALKGGV